MSWDILCFLMSFLPAKSKFRMKTPGPKLLCFSLTFIVVFQLTIAASESSACTDCHNGYCDSSTEECVCYDGWTGDKCEHCSGRLRLTAPSGYIHESSDNYKALQRCTWLIDSQRNDTPIHLQLESFGTECSWDHLYIYDGDSVYSPLVAALSGPIRHESEELLHQFTLNSGYAYLYFYSDAAYVLDGFNISYSIGDCTGRNCSGNGFCNTTTFQCQCDEGWSGEDCTIPLCPDDCGLTGTCVGNQCICEEGYYGRDCGTRVSNGLWEIHDETTAFARASSASVLIGDELWVIGGYTFSREDYMPVYKYDFTSGVSEQVPLTSSSTMPAPRYAHSATLYEDIILVYGGNLIDGPVTSELWALNTTSLTWELQYNNESEGEAIEGHTAHTINDTMLVFFGYSPIFGYVGWVMQYHILNNTWSRLDVSGHPVLGGYGHSSLYREEQNKVYIYAGYPFNRLTGEDTIQDLFYEFDVEKLEWNILPSAGQPRFLHSAVLHNSKMYVFGGNSHTDNSKYQGSQCYSNSFMVYDFDCSQWHEEELSSGLKAEIARFGHQGVMYDDVMWLFGGFNGVVLDTVVTYTPANCSSISNETSCELAGLGSTCMWDITLSECSQLTSKETLLHNVSFMECDPTEILANCSEPTSCSDCILLQGCGWCDSICSSSCPNKTNSYTCSPYNCKYHQDCDDCNEDKNCKFDIKGSCGEYEYKVQPSEEGCPAPCSSMNNCESCTGTDRGGCMWCESQKQCIDSSTYMTSFVYGTCLAWYTGSCEAGVECSQYDTCDQCQEHPSCGWCDRGNSTGLGACIAGSYTGPVNETTDEVDYGYCSADRWYFTDCPSCQCNGHSVCLDGENCTNCRDSTEGEHCDTCELGYYGNPLNGGNCTECECNGHSEYCIQNSVESKCFCDTKGIIGDSCDSCDRSRGYLGDPTLNTCYYQLTVNFQYTFNESEPEIVNVTKENLWLRPDGDRYDIDFILAVTEPVSLTITVTTNRLSMNYKYTFQLDDDQGENLTKINLFVQPEVVNKDIDFTLSVDEPVSFTITYTTSTVENEEIIVENRYVDDRFDYRFSRYTYDFSQGGNTTFLFYISNFTHPFTFQCIIHPTVVNTGMVTPTIGAAPTWGSLFGSRSFVLSSLVVIVAMIVLIACQHPGWFTSVPGRAQRIYLEENMFTIIVITFGSLIGFLSLCALTLLLVQKMCVCYYNRQFSQVQVTQMIRLEELLTFFVIFFSVFLSFMCFFAFGWKLKMRIDAYFRGQVVIIQLWGVNVGMLFLSFFACFFLLLVVFLAAIKGSQLLGRQRRRQVTVRQMISLVLLFSTFFACLLFLIGVFLVAIKGHGRYSRMRSRQVVVHQLTVNLLLLFVTFFACCVLLLGVFFAAVKGRERCMRIRRRQLLIYHRPWVNWLAVLVTFVACFVSFLLISLAFIKGRERFDRIRRVRQREVEMAEMAARPFASIFVEIGSKAPPPDLIATTKPKPTAVAFATETLKENKAALATIVLQLPFLEGQVPVGQTGISLATGLVIPNKGKKTESRPPPVIHEPPASRTPESSELTPRFSTSNGRPNTARDIQLSCDDVSTTGEVHAYDNPAMV